MENFNEIIRLEDMPPAFLAGYTVICSLAELTWMDIQPLTDRINKRNYSNFSLEMREGIR